MDLEGVRVEDVELVEVMELVRFGIVMVAARSSAVGLLLYMCVDAVSMGLGVCMMGNEVEMRTGLDGEEEEVEVSAGVDGTVGDGGREPKEVVREL